MDWSRERAIVSSVNKPRPHLHHRNLLFFFFFFFCCSGSSIPTKTKRQKVSSGNAHTCITVGCLCLFSFLLFLVGVITLAMSHDLTHPNLKMTKMPQTLLNSW